MRRVEDRFVMTLNLFPLAKAFDESALPRDAVNERVAVAPASLSMMSVSPESSGGTRTAVPDAVEDLYGSKTAYCSSEVSPSYPGK